MSVGWVAVGATALGGIYAADSAADSAGDATAAGERSAAAANQLGQDELAFSKQQYADAKPFRDKAAGTAQEISEAQLASQKQNDELAADYAAYNKGTFRPLEQSIVDNAEGYDTPEKRQAAADAAMADVNKGFAATGEARARQMAANGVNPGSTRSIAALDGQDATQATALAGAAYQARKGVETTGTALKADAANLGRNLPSNQATSAGVAINAGNSAVSNALNGVNATSAGVQGVQAGYQGAISAAGTAGQLNNSAANIAANVGAQSNALWGSIGSTAGRLINQPRTPTTTAAYNPASSYSYENGSDIGWNPGGISTSDENVKEGIKPANADTALEEIAATPVKRWRYSPAKMAAAGLPMDDGTEHTGPMAQRVNETMGEGAAPGSKRLDLITMNGKAMLGIQALDKKTNKLAKEVNSLASMIRSGKIQAGAR